jgi:hypothetical protein
MADYKSAVSYTVDNWAVSTQPDDTITAGKTLPIFDLDFENDWSRDKSDNDYSTFANISTDAIGAPETIQYRHTRINDVYANLDVPSAYRYQIRTGDRAVVSVLSHVKCVNSVSGETVIMPIRARLDVSIPNASFIKKDLLEYAIGRVIAAAFDTGSIDSNRLIAVERGKTEL